MKNYIISIIIIILIVGCSSTKNSFNRAFSSEQVSMIMNADSLIPMRVYKITNKQDSLLLRKKSEYIKANPKDAV